MAPGTNCELSDFLKHVEKCKWFAIADTSPTGTRPIVSTRAPQFNETQWKFCAKRLVYDRLNDTRLHANEVVPFRKKHPLKEGSDSTIFRVELFEEYNHLFPVGQSSERIQVQAYIVSH